MKIPSEINQPLLGKESVARLWYLSATSWLNVSEKFSAFTAETIVVMESIRFCRIVGTTLRHSSFEKPFRLIIWNWRYKNTLSNKNICILLGLKVNILIGVQVFQMAKIFNVGSIKIRTSHNCNIKWGFSKQVIIKSQGQFMYGSSFYGSDVKSTWTKTTKFPWNFGWFWSCVGKICKILMFLSSHFCFLVFGHFWQQCY